MTNLARSENHTRKTTLRVSSPLAWLVSALILLLACSGLSGCGNDAYSYPTPGARLSGSVIGGQNPVSASTIQLYAVGTTGDGSTSTPLISATFTTSDGSSTSNSNANPGNLNNTLPLGSFTIPSLAYTCPASSEVYMVSSGGDPGLGTGMNANLTLMTALGLCSNLSASTFVTMNELTTVSSLAALSDFATTYDAIGSGFSDASQLLAQTNEVPEYTNTANGTVPGSALPAGYSASSTAIQTLGDIVAACVNSAGGTAGDTSPCGKLFHLATISGNPAPTNTVDAVINILNQPTVNVPQIFALLPASNPFQPTLSAAPANWLLPITSNTATQLAFTVAPTSTAAGSSITPGIAVSIEDAGNNVQTSATNTITLAIGANPGSGTLNGATTVTAINGVATFTGLAINKTGTGYTFTASATGLAGAPSGTFNITPGTATKLIFGVQPSNASAGASISPAVTVLVEDSNGNVVTTSTASVTMAIGSNPSSGTLGGTVSVNAVAGVATFSTLSIDNSGTGYTLSASSNGLSGKTSSSFNVN
jgi:hypothetical protein